MHGEVKKSHFDEESNKLIHFCATGDLYNVKKLCLNPNLDLDIADYDGRTAIHLAASEGHKNICQFLIENGVKEINPVDKFGNTPLDDAKRGNF